uniref:Uncharacterized protein n=1 Tax=Noccaea caerulescens TaxID=107243 RepID=A0A1J3HWS1_NOCCA
MRIESDQSSASQYDSYNTGSDESLPETSSSSSAKSGGRSGVAPPSGGDLSTTPAPSPIANIVVPSLMDSPDSVDHVPISVRRALLVPERTALPKGFEDLYSTEVGPSVPIVPSKRKEMADARKKGKAAGPKRGKAMNASRVLVGKKGRKATAPRSAPEKKNTQPPPRDLRKLGRTLCTEEDLREIRQYNSRASGLAIRLPEEDERPWKAPPGWFTAYKFWFSESQISFPLPKLLIAYCEEVGVAMSQLCPAAIRNIVGPLVLAAELDIDIDLRFFEAMSSITVNKRTPGTLYVSIRSKYGVITGHPSKTRNWLEEYFFVRVNEASVPDVRRPYRNEWSPTFGRRPSGAAMLVISSSCRSLSSDGCFFVQIVLLFGEFLHPTFPETLGGFLSSARGGGKTLIGRGLKGSGLASKRVRVSLFVFIPAELYHDSAPPFSFLAVRKTKGCCEDGKDLLEPAAIWEGGGERRGCAKSSERGSDRGGSDCYCALVCHDRRQGECCRGRRSFHRRLFRQLRGTGLYSR